jgi:hypothetical protein
MMLTKQDRCDGCAAAAAVILYKNDRTLQFCGHHIAQHRTKLVEQGWALRAEEKELVPA